ncbi:pectinesterase inhibitor 7-like [Cajanus cajan]|uniref:pectinesterase inhibitor 7-like n=1 Tax=Cajanus cajan TaxID=3821 RepID=UPI00098DB5F6|nr:pectinesterase inhibitor 7-like [Cajanus cajan]
MANKPVLVVHTTIPFRFSLLLFTFTFTFSHFTLSATAVTTAPDASGDIDFIRASCNTTLYQDLCLSRFAAVVHRSHANLARVAVAVSLSKAHGAAAYRTSQSATEPPHQPRVVLDCSVELFRHIRAASIGVLL